MKFQTTQRVPRSAILILTTVLLGLSVVGVGALSATVTAQSTLIDGCQEINSSGTYVLEPNNITSTSGTCIEITASGVTFEGDNNAIVDETYGSVAVRVTADNVVVKNVTARQVRTAVALSGASNTRIENVAVDEATGTIGTPSTSQTAITVTGGTNNEIRDSSIFNPGESSSSGSHGILIEDSSDNLVAGNDISAPGSTGIVLDNADNTSLIENDITGASIGPRSSEAGIQVGKLGDGSTASDNNQIRDNTIDGDGFGGGLPELGDGVLIYAGTGNELNGNIVEGVVGRGIAVDDDDAIITGNTIGGTVGEGIGKGGILITADASGANLTDNYVSGAGTEDDSPGVTDHGASTEIVGNTIEDNENTGLLISNASPADIRDNTFQFNDGRAVDIENTPSVTVANLILGRGSEPITISGKNFGIDRARAPTADLPPTEQDLGIFLDTDTNTGGNLNEIRITYQDADVELFDESSLRVWTYNGSWNEISGSNSVTPADNVVSADPPAGNITLAPLLNNSPPSATATVSSTSVAPNETVRLNASASFDSDGQIVQYEWDVDGDGAFEKQTPTPTATHNYAEDATGSYDVTLRVTDRGDDTDTDSVTVDVSERPIAELSISLAPTSTDATTTFTASNSTFAYGDIAEYQWDFTGDGEIDRTTTAPQINHTYASPGNYSPTVTVIGDDNSRSTTSQPLVVRQNLPPAPVEGASGISYTLSRGFSGGNWVGDNLRIFVQNIEDPDGTIAEYRWDLDGDGTIDRNTTDSALTHSFGEPGTFTVTADIVDDDGAVRSESVDIAIARQKTGRITGTITDTNTGAPIAGTPVVLFETEQFVENANVTNTTGQYQFTGIDTISDVSVGNSDRDVYNVTVNPDGYTPAHKEVTVDENTTTIADFNLQPINTSPENGTLSLVITGSDGAGRLENATVEIRNRTDTVATATTDRFGDVSLSVPAGYYTVYVDKEEYEPETRIVSIVKNDTSFLLSGSSSIELERTPQENFIASIDSTNAPITAGERLRINATIENTGAAFGTQNVTLNIAGGEQDSTAVSLAAGATTTITLEWNTSSNDARSTGYSPGVITNDDSAITTVQVKFPQPTAALSMLSIANDGNETSVVETTGRDIEFTVNNTGQQDTAFTIGLNITSDTGVSVVNLTDSTSTLPPGGTETLTYPNITRQFAPGNYTVTVSTGTDALSGTLQVVRAATVNIPLADVRIDGESVLSGPSDLVEGDVADAVVSATNENSRPGASIVTFILGQDGQTVVEQTRRVTLAANETTSLRFSDVTSTLSAGFYDLVVSPTVGSGTGRASDVILVQEPSATLLVTNPTPATATVDNGTTLNISATIENINSSDDTQTVTLSVGGQRLDSETVTVPGNTTTSVNFTQIDTGQLGPGEYIYNITTADGSATGSLVVEVEGPSIADYANDDEIVDVTGLLDAIADFRSDEIGVDLLLEVIDAFRRGTPVV